MLLKSFSFKIVTYLIKRNIMNISNNFTISTSEYIFPQYNEFVERLSCQYFFRAADYEDNIVENNAKKIASIAAYYFSGLRMEISQFNLLFHSMMQGIREGEDPYTKISIPAFQKQHYEAFEWASIKTAIRFSIVDMQKQYKKDLKKLLENQEIEENNEVFHSSPVQMGRQDGDYQEIKEKNQRRDLKSSYEQISPF
jgi:hypothetical protein